MSEVSYPRTQLSDLKPLNLKSSTLIIGHCVPQHVQGY